MCELTIFGKKLCSPGDQLQKFIIFLIDLMPRSGIVKATPFWKTTDITFLAAELCMELHVIVPWNKGGAKRISQIFQSSVELVTFMQFISQPFSKH